MCLWATHTPKPSFGWETSLLLHASLICLILFVCWSRWCSLGVCKLWCGWCVCACARLHLHGCFARIWALKIKVLGLSVGQQVNGLKHTNAKTQKDTQSQTGTFICLTPLWQRVWQHKAFVTCATIMVDWKTAHGPHLNGSSYFPRVSQVKSFWHYQTSSASDMCICVRTRSRVSPS